MLYGSCVLLVALVGCLALEAASMPLDPATLSMQEREVRTSLLPGVTTSPPITALPFPPPGHRPIPSLPPMKV